MEPVPHLTAIPQTPTGRSGSGKVEWRVEMDEQHQVPIFQIRGKKHKDEWYVVTMWSLETDYWHQEPSVSGYETAFESAAQRARELLKQARPPKEKLTRIPPKKLKKK